MPVFNPLLNKDKPQSENDWGVFLCEVMGIFLRGYHLTPTLSWLGEGVL
jgi:hypothetical protein